METDNLRSLLTKVEDQMGAHLFCFGDTMIINDSRYHYFTGVYAIELSQYWKRKDTFLMTSDVLSMKLVPISNKEVFDDMVKKAR